MKMKYTSKQNMDHWLHALCAVHYGSDNRPDDCPASRWKSLMREAKLSMPSMSEAVDLHVRSRTRTGKYIHSISK